MAIFTAIPITAVLGVRDEAFYAESELSEADDGSKLSPQGTPVNVAEEDSYFFRLSAYTDKLLAHFEAHPEFLQPQSRRNEVVSFLKGGLKDLPILRTAFDQGKLRWRDPSHVVYVYQMRADQLSVRSRLPGARGCHADFWPAGLHVIGWQGYTRFHTVYWPAFLMAADLPLPKQVFAHGFLSGGYGEKMSKSLGNVLDPFTLAAHYGVDAALFFARSAFGRDGSFSGRSHRQSGKC